MRILAIELVESLRIAFAQIWAHRLRSALTALGVIIGIVAVTLMGAALGGINDKFESSMALIGNDILYVQKWPWSDHNQWWKYADWPPMKPGEAVMLNRIISSTPDSLLVAASFVASRQTALRAGPNSVSGVYTSGEDYRFQDVHAKNFLEGRFFTQEEAEGGRPVVVLGSDVAQALFPASTALGRTVTMDGHPLRVVGVLARQGEFLGLFSFDNQIQLPIAVFRRYYDIQAGDLALHVRAADQRRMPAATDELVGAMRRVRGLRPEQPDNFTINQQEAFEDQLAPIRAGIAIAGFFVTGLALFVGAIGIMNITFVGVKERTREIGTRKALGARRRSILLQFLIEAVSICLVGGVIGLAFTFGLGTAAERLFPNLPISLSPGLILTGLIVSIATGVAAGFTPALGAARLDPVEALRYE